MRIGLRRFAGAANGDATTLDGLDSSYFATADHTHPPSGVTDHGALTGLDDNDHPQYLLSSGYTAADVFAKVLTLDGSGSGLDADTLDGLSSLAFIKADGTVTGATAGTQAFTNLVRFNTGILMNQAMSGTSNVIYTGGTSSGAVNNTFGFMVAGVGSSFNNTIGPYFGARGNTFNGVANQRGNIFFVAGYPTSPTSGEGQIRFIGGSPETVNALIDKTGYAFFGGNTIPTALVDIAASGAARASLRIRNGTWPTTPNDGEFGNDGNAINIMVNGTNAVNTDGGIRIYMQSSTDDRPVGGLLWQYTTKTDATRATQGSLTAWYTSTERKAITWGSDASGPLLSFGTVTTPIAIQVLATGASATPDDIITALQNLGLVKQS